MNCLRTLLFGLSGMAAAYWLIPDYEIVSNLTIGRNGEPFSAKEILTLVGIFAGWILLGYGLQAMVRGKRRLATWQIHWHGLLWLGFGFALTLVSNVMVTTVTINPNFYLFAAGLAAILATSSWLVSLWRRQSSRALPLNFAAICFNLPAACLTLAAAVTIWSLYQYMFDLSFRNELNAFRSKVVLNQDAPFQLVPLVPEKTYEQPIDLALDPTDPNVLWYLTRTGKLNRLEQDSGRESTQVDFSPTVVTNIENGALGFALHPNFGQRDRPDHASVFVYLTEEGQPRKGRPTQINRLTKVDLALPQDARVASATDLWVSRSAGNGSHNAGGVRFGPDGMLYFSVGDRGNPANGQDLRKRLAAGIFRIDVDQRGGPVSHSIRQRPKNERTQNYFIPSDNPFVGQPGVLEEYWALGMRNPFRFGFDLNRGGMWLGDVGSDLFEEINYFQAGANGGWPLWEGEQNLRPKASLSLGQLTQPWHHYAQDSLFRVAIGGLIYDGARYPELQGQYLFMENQAGLIFALDPSAKGRAPKLVARTDHLGQFGMTSMLVDADGAILVATLGPKGKPGGRILKLMAGDQSLLTATQLPQTPQQIPAHQQFAMTCARCHGAEGQGVTIAEGVTPRDLSDPVWQAAVSREHIAAVIRDGGAAHGLSPLMPAWGKSLSDKQITGLVDVVRALGRDRRQAENDADLSQDVKM